MKSLIADARDHWRSRAFFVTLALLVGSLSVANPWPEPSKFVTIEGDRGPLVAYQSLWPNFPIELQYRKIRIEAREALLLTHNESHYDRRMTTFSAADQAIGNFVRKGAPIISLVAPTDSARSLLKLKAGTGQTLYPSRITETIPVLFDGDYHLVTFNVQDLYMTGGYLTRCFCQSLRSVLLTSHVRRIHFVLQGIYAQFPDFWHRRGERNEMNVFQATIYPEESLKLPKWLQNLSGKILDTNLAAALSDLPNESLFRFFREGLFGNADDGLPYCDGWRRMDSKTVRYTVHIYREGNLLGSVGSGDIPIDLILHF